MPFTRYFGVFSPSDLEVMQKIYDELCAERRIALEDSCQREELAAKILHVFMQGKTSEADLWKSLSRGDLQDRQPLDEYSASIGDSPRHS